MVVPQEPTQPLTTFDFTIRVPEFFPRFDDLVVRVLPASVRSADFLCGP